MRNQYREYYMCPECHTDDQVEVIGIRESDGPRGDRASLKCNDCARWFYVYINDLPGEEEQVFIR